MAINSSLLYRVGFYNKNTNECTIYEDQLSRERAIQEVKNHLRDHDDPDEDVFVAVMPFPSDPDFCARDIPATEEAHQVSEDESDSDSLASSPPPHPKTPPLPDSPAAQAAIFFPENETDSQRQERTDAATLFTTYPLTAKDLWSRFHKPPIVESTMFDIWETGRRPTQGPEAAKDMVRANIDRMKSGKAWELQAIEENM